MPQKRLSSLRFSLFIFSILVSGCEQKNNSDGSVTSASDSVIAEEIQEQPIEENEEVQPMGSDLIKFNGTTEDEVSSTLKHLPLFDRVYQVFGEYINIQDSLESARKLWGQALTDPKDTLMVFSYKERAYQAIIDYKKQVASPTIAQNNFPTLLNLTRIPEPEDSSSFFLPQAAPSGVLSAGDFFFLGGAPFLSKLSPLDDHNIFTDQKGNPEMRFGMSLQDNVSYLLYSICHAKSTAIDIAYGPPLHTYEMGQVEVYGIGSLIHKFVERIPAFFITDKGLIPAHLLSAELKLGSDYSCGDGDVYVEFSCSKSIDEKEIQAIYIPYGTAPTSCSFNRVSDHVWTADLNSDGTADFACVTNNYMGDIGYEIAEALWFANINGEWKIIDWAEIPECT